MDDFLPRGTSFARLAIAQAVGAIQLRRGDVQPHGALRYAEKRWGRASSTATVLKSAVASGASTDGDYGSMLADTQQALAEFLELVAPQTILGKLAGLRRVPADVLVTTQTGGTTAYWIGQSKAARVSRIAFQREKLNARRIVGLTVLSNAVLQDQSRAAEDLVRGDLIRSSIELSDATFIDPTASGVAGVSPASVTSDAPTFASTGVLEDDLTALLDIFTGDLQTASWILHPRLAASIALRAGGRGAAASLGARGGELLGLPAIVSTAVPQDSSGGMIALVDAAGIAVVDEGAEISVASETAVELDDGPTGATDTPTAASANFVGLWQTESTALKVTRRINWTVRRPGAVVTVTGCAYEGS